MAEIYTTVEVDTEVDISVEEFYDACSTYEKKELIDLLKDDGYLNGGLIVDEDNTTYIDDEFGMYLSKISNNRIILTIDEEEIIKKIASRL